MRWTHPIALSFYTVTTRAWKMTRSHPHQPSYKSDRILSENGQCVNIHPNMILGDRIIFLHCHYKSLEDQAIALAQPVYMSDRIPFCTVAIRLGRRGDRTLINPQIRASQSFLHCPLCKAVLSINMVRYISLTRYQRTAIALQFKSTRIRFLRLPEPPKRTRRNANLVAGATVQRVPRAEYRYSPPAPIDCGEY